MEKLIGHFKPDLFIPGAAKSGTTSLHDLLNAHPEISMSSTKEPGYWKNKKFSKFNINDLFKYKNLFDEKKKIKGESSTAYMFHDSFIKNIKKNYQESPKFIFILRNPVDRFVSHVNWMKGLGLEKDKVEKIINQKTKFRFKEYDDFPKYYYEFGLYNRWITRFISNFGSENIKIITFESLFANKLTILNECFDFIGVNRITEIQDIVSNKTKTIVFPNMYHFLRKLATGRIAYTKYLKYLLPKKNRSDVKYLIRFIIKKWIKKDLQYKELDKHHRKYLTDLYKDDVKKLKINLNYEFSEWKDFN